MIDTDKLLQINHLINLVDEEVLTEEEALSCILSLYNGLTPRLIYAIFEYQVISLVTKQISEVLTKHYG